MRIINVAKSYSKLERLKPPYFNSIVLGEFESAFLSFLFSYLDRKTWRFILHLILIQVTFTISIMDNYKKVFIDELH